MIAIKTIWRGSDQNIWRYTSRIHVWGGLLFVWIFFVTWCAHGMWWDVMWYDAVWLWLGYEYDVICCDMVMIWCNCDDVMWCDDHMWRDVMWRMTRVMWRMTRMWWDVMSCDAESSGCIPVIPVVFLLFLPYSCRIPAIPAIPARS